MPESSSSRPARSRKLSEARARLPPRLTRLTPSENSVGASVRLDQPGHHVERCGDRLGEPADVVLLDHAGDEDAVGARLDVPHRPLDRLVEEVTRRAAEPGVRARVEHEGPGGRRGPRRGDPVRGLVDREQLAADLVLEVAAHRPGLDRPADGGAHVVVPGLQVRGDRYADRGHDPGHVLEHRVEVQRSTVGHSQRPGDAGARGGDRREPDLLEDPRGPGVPGVGQHEARALVECQEVCGGHRTSTSAWSAPPESRA